MRVVKGISDLCISDLQNFEENKDAFTLLCLAYASSFEEVVDILNMFSAIGIQSLRQPCLATGSPYKSTHSKSLIVHI